METRLVTQRIYFAAIIIIVACGCVIVWLWGCGVVRSRGVYGVDMVVATFHFSVLGFCARYIGCRRYPLYRGSF